MIQPTAGEFGFSLNPLHYVKKAAVGLYHVDKAILKNKLVQQGAATAANAYAPGSGAIVQAGLQTIAPAGGGTVATPAGQPAAAPMPPMPPTSMPSASENASYAPGGGGGDQLFGMPKKYVLIGGGVLGAVILLKILR